IVLAQERISLDKDGEFKKQRDCIRGCLLEGWDMYDLDGFLGCRDSWYNECFCRADRASEADRFLSTCIKSGCGASATVDLSIAQSVYHQYCSTA
ncbi:hypothetical protein BKA66DRAFT_382006, partial [Pyrenochaeta sp. MPI-SDFR-AT-0127]